MKESIDESDHVKYTDVSISKSDETTTEQQETQDFLQNKTISDPTIPETQLSGNTTQDSREEYTIGVQEEKVALSFEKDNVKTNQEISDHNDQIECLSNSVSSMNVSDTEHNDTNINSDIPVFIAKDNEVFEVLKKLLLQPPSRKIIHVQKNLEKTCTANFCNFNESQLESTTEDYSANKYTNNDLEDTVDLEEEDLNEGNK